MEQSTSAPQEKVQQVAGQAQEKAQEAAGQAKYQLRGQVDQRSTQAGEQVSSQASDLRTVAEQLRQQGKDQPAKLADQAADRAERLGGYLKDSDADRILGDIEDFGRRQPLAVIAGGLALGFAASRFLKASSSDRFEQRGPSGRFQSSPSREPIGQLARSTPAVPPTAHPVPPVADPAPVGLDAPPMPPATGVPPRTPGGSYQ